MSATNEVSGVARLLAQRAADQMAGHRKAWRVAVKAAAADKPLTEKQLDAVAEASRALGFAPEHFDEHVRLLKGHQQAAARLAAFPSPAEVDAMTDEADWRCEEIDAEIVRLKALRPVVYDAAHDVLNGRHLAAGNLQNALDALPAVIREDM